MEAVSRGGLIVQIFKKIKEAKYLQDSNSRLCGNLTQIDMHVKSTETGNNHVNTFKVYVKVDYSKCYICGVYLHLVANRGQSAGRTYLFDHHNDDFFVWHVQMHYFQKPKVRTGIIPHLLRKSKIKGI